MGPSIICRTDLREFTVAAGHSKKMPSSKLKHGQDGLDARLGHFEWSAVSEARVNRPRRHPRSVVLVPYSTIMTFSLTLWLRLPFCHL